MDIQSLSIVVPTKNTCVNNCKFCVSRTHTNPYDDRINSVIGEYINTNTSEELAHRDYRNRLQFARDNGCNVIVLTGTGEPLQNPRFIDYFLKVNETLKTPFKSIEIQTTGVLITPEILEGLRQGGITTISLSISNIFDNERNLQLIECKKHLRFKLYDVIKQIKSAGFNLRLSLNLVNDYDKYSVKDVLKMCKALGADQVTFRKLYKSNTNTNIDEWIEDNASVNFFPELVEYVEKIGTFLGYLPFGPKIFDIDGMAIVIDSDCMAEEVQKNTYKYLILRENAKLYHKWETKASLLF